MPKSSRPNMVIKPTHRHPRIQTLSKSTSGQTNRNFGKDQKQTLIFPSPYNNCVECVQRCFMWVSDGLAVITGRLGGARSQQMGKT